MTSGSTRCGRTHGGSDSRHVLQIFFHDHALKISSLADKYDSRVLAHVCITRMRDTVFNTFVDGAKGYWYHELPSLRRYLSVDQQDDFLNMHYYPALQTSGGEYPERLLEVFAIIARYCNWNGRTRHEETKPYLIKEILLSNHRLAFFCMWHESFCDVPELHREYAVWLGEGDKSFLVRWGMEASSKGMASMAKLEEGYYRRSVVGLTNLNNDE